MRKLHHFLLTGIIFLCFTVPTMAQKLPKFSAWASLSAMQPKDETLTQLYHNGYGAELGFGVGLGKTMLYATVGYQHYKSKLGSIVYPGLGYGTFSDLDLVPLQIGIKHYLPLGLYVNGSIGGVYQKSAAEGVLYGNQVKENVSSGAFIWEYGGGIRVFKLIELGVAYNGFRNNNTDGTVYNSRLLKLKAGVVLKL